MIKRILAEPLVAFLALGGLLFLVYAVTGEAPEPREDQIVISPEIEGQLAVNFEQTWRRPPTEQEAEGLLNSWIRQEVLVQEALDLGLDRDDTIIRQRLQQKMEFLLSALAEALQPSDEELQAHLDENTEAFVEPTRIAFEQVYLGAAPSESLVQSVTDALQDGAAPETLGERTLLPARFALSAPTAIDSALGPGMSARISDLPAGEWVGPVQSGYGWHVIRITDRVEGRLPELSEIRDKLETAWRATKSRELMETQYANLLNRYEVVRPEDRE